MIDVLFSSTAPLSPASARKVCSEHIARTVGYLDKVDVSALTEAVATALLERDGYEPDAHLHDDEPCASCAAKYGAPPSRVAETVLLSTALVETVLDEARKAIRLRMAIDVASNLLPRLVPKEF